MKARTASSLRDLTTAQLEDQLKESEETLAKQRFQSSLSQLHDTAYLKILRKDIARMNMIISERKKANK